MIEFLTNYWALMSLILIILGLIFYMVLSVRKTEKERTKWIKNIHLGYMCHISAVGKNHLNSVEIVEMDDEYVVVEVKVRKRWVYPPKK